MCCRCKHREVWPARYDVEVAEWSYFKLWLSHVPKQVGLIICYYIVYHTEMRSFFRVESEIVWFSNLSVTTSCVLSFLYEIPMELEINVKLKLYLSSLKHGCPDLLHTCIQYAIWQYCMHNSGNIACTTLAILHAQLWQYCMHNSGNIACTTLAILHAQLWQYCMHTSLHRYGYNSITK